MAVDPRTPVIVGVGQFTERIDDPDYRGMSAVDLATAAARAALADTWADEAKVAKAVDTVFGLRQFEISGRMPATLGLSNNYPRSVMNRLGADPARVVLEPVGGQSPQKLVTEAGNAIFAGDADVVMIMGSEPGSTAKYFADRDDRPDFTEHVEVGSRTAATRSTATSTSTPSSTVSRVLRRTTACSTTRGVRASA